MISEAVLIQMAQRRRRLEDLLEEADELLSRYESVQRSSGVGTRKVRDLRNEIELSTEACRDDMVTLQDAVRSTGQKKGEGRRQLAAAGGVS